jgi:hypothetical protein
MNRISLHSFMAIKFVYFVLCHLGWGRVWTRVYNPPMTFTILLGRWVGNTGCPAKSSTKGGHPKYEASDLCISKVSGACLVDSVITGNSPHGCTAGWGFPIRSLLHTETHVGLHTKCLICCCLILTKIWMCWQIFIKVHNTKFHENLFSHSRGVAHEQTDMVKLIGTFAQLLVANKPKNTNSTWFLLCDEDVC